MTVRRLIQDLLGLNELLFLSSSDNSRDGDFEPMCRNDVDLSRRIDLGMCTCVSGGRRCDREGRIEGISSEQRGALWLQVEQSKLESDRGGRLDRSR